MKTVLYLRAVLSRALQGLAWCHTLTVLEPCKCMRVDPMAELPTELVVCLQTIVFGSFHYRAAVSTAFTSASDQELGHSTPGANGTGAETCGLRPVDGQDLGDAGLDLEV